ncbi:hypothetical protein BU17DRAFT_88803 [Hysterangium stoloniferum]|nr:hypothetical protein BU17DRAFT_88803 [Hysterangium stoloniferum]
MDAELAKVSVYIKTALTCRCSVNVSEAITDIRSRLFKKWTYNSSISVGWQNTNIHLHQPDPSVETVHDFGLFKLDEILHTSEKPLSEYLHMPQFTEPWEERVGNSFINEQSAYDQPTEQIKADINIEKLNEGQKVAYNQIIDAVIARHGTGVDGKLFFLNGHT